VVRLLVEMLSPYHGRIYDPCCGSGGMFVQSEKFVEAHGGRFGDISIYGQESNATTRRLAVMNLALRGIEADVGPEHADTFRRDLHPDLRADYVLANPPFNDSDWFRKDDDVRWQYGVPPKGNANFAWVQHFVHHLAPTGTAGFVLANGSMSSNQSGEGDIRKALVEADLVDCMVALPGQLFYSTQIPVCLWFLTRSKAQRTISVPGEDLPEFNRDRRRETLFIDARKMGTLVDRVHRELTEADILRIVSTYHLWKNDHRAMRAEADRLGILLDIPSPYGDAPGFCSGDDRGDRRARLRADAGTLRRRGGGGGRRGAVRGEDGEADHGARKALRGVSPTRAADQVESGPPPAWPLNAPQRPAS
jgi:type I restriction enzyme M protein